MASSSGIIIINNYMIWWNIVRACALFGCFAVNFVSSKTESSHVSALNVMYTSMNSPSKLDGWKSSGGDPCGDSWMGVTCSGSKVTEIVLSDMGLTGSIGYKLNDLTSVTIFDLSKNKFTGSIPYQLPPNLHRLYLSKSGFTGQVPYSIAEMKNLRELYLNDNKLNGQLSDMFGKLPKLDTVDLASNSLTGNLPQSMKNLTSLQTLHLQKNQFTGSINVLRNLPQLDDLNVADNKFTGWIPNELKTINNLKTGGNSWSPGPAPPPPPGTKNIKRKNNNSNNKSGLSGGAIAGIIFAVLIVLALGIFLFTRRRSSPPPSHYLHDDTSSQHKPFTSLSFRDRDRDRDQDQAAREVLKPEPRAESRLDFRELESFKSSASFRAKNSVSSASMRTKPPSSPFINNNNNNNEYVTRTSSVHVNVVPYALAELQTATGNFASSRLLGAGSIGRVYRAKYADGKVLVVKKIESSFLRGTGIEFAEIVSGISKLQHPNICELVGYCSEQGHNMLVCEYFRNGSLHEFLHLSDAFSRPLTWNTRVRIALGTARALEYLHEVCSPPCVHKNIKSSNILLDTELNPRLTDCGLAMLHERQSHETVNGSGYKAPECKDGGGGKMINYSSKSDVYSFGVVMLELMTGRMAMDSRKPKFERCLARWASPQLHDIDALEAMADPALHGLYPPKSLSRFADVISQCIQAEPEFRPAMSQVVNTLARLAQNTTGDDLSSSRRTNRDDDSDYELHY